MPIPHSFPAYRSVLRADSLVTQVLAAYSLGKITACYLFTRKINDIYIVTSTQGRYILRVTTANGRTPAQVQGEIDLLRALARRGIAVGIPRTRDDGASLTMIDAPEGRRTAVLFDYVPHDPIHDFDETHAHRYGRALAEIHRAADKLAITLERPAHDRDFFITHALTQLARFPLLQEAVVNLADVESIADDAWRIAAALARTAPIYGVCHGDANNDNALIGADGTVTFIDFDYAGIGWRVYDLATFLWAHLIDAPEAEADARRIFRAMLVGYESVRPLTAVEHAALPAFVVLRHLFFLGTATEYAHGYGLAWLSGGWITRMIAFLRARHAEISRPTGD